MSNRSPTPTHASSIGEALERIISDGIEAANQDYSLPHQSEKREGSVHGFNSCNGKTPAELAMLLEQANRSAQEHWGQDDYWYWRCRAAEVEWVCNVMSAILHANRLPVIINPTARGTLKAAEIIGVSA